MNATIAERMVEIPVGSVVLHGDLRIPQRPVGLVIFAHGSGSSRFSARNRQVAESLQVPRVRHVAAGSRRPWRCTA